MSDEERRRQFFDDDNNEGGGGGNKDMSEYCCVWPLSLMNDKPVFRLFLVMFLNGLLSMACSAAIMEIERPEQLERMGKREQLQKKMDVLHSNLTDLINKMGTEDYDGDGAVALLDKYLHVLLDYFL